jgi:hypothetical protein
MTKSNSTISGLVQLLIVVAIVLIGVLMTKDNRAFAWVLTLVLMLFFIAMAGKSITGLWLGALIDKRNKISLSRLQMILWTIIVLSAFLTVALYSVATGAANPLMVEIPTQLWMLIGISTTSLVGSALVKGNNMQRNPTTKAGKKMVKEDVEAGRQQIVGVVGTNDNPANAKWGDMFKDEGVINRDNLDLSKIQMFFFTIVLFIAYAAALWQLFDGSGVVTRLPEVSKEMNVLLGISHAGYLTTKTIPQD